MHNYQTNLERTNRGFSIPLLFVFSVGSRIHLLDQASPFHRQHQKYRIDRINPQTDQAHSFQINQYAEQVHTGQIEHNGRDPTNGQ